MGADGLRGRDQEENGDRENRAVLQAGDRGIAGSEPSNTTDDEQPSALGGKTATRSAVDPAPSPAEERSE